jgi:hypothetical protein
VNALGAPVAGSFGRHPGRSDRHGVAAHGTTTALRGGIFERESSRVFPGGGRASVPPGGTLRGGMYIWAIRGSGKSPSRARRTTPQFTGKGTVSAPELRPAIPLLIQEFEIPSRTPRRSQRTTRTTPEGPVGFRRRSNTTRTVRFRTALSARSMATDAVRPERDWKPEERGARARGPAAS